MEWDATKIRSLPEFITLAKGNGFWVINVLTNFTKISKCARTHERPVSKKSPLCHRPALDQDDQG